MVELGVITSHPGAERQTVHADVEFCSTARRIWTTFIALQDVTADMGPTLVWPGTHTDYFCDFLKPRMCGPVDRYYAEHPPRALTLRAGDAVLMDTRVMHCGGANESSADRMLLHFSLQTIAEPDAPVGFTYNLDSHLQREQRVLRELLS